MCDGFSMETRFGVHLYEFASMCVVLFFAISGYLVHGSLVRTPNLREFYKKKLVRLIVPFTVAWFIMSAIMIFLALLNPDMTEKVTLFHALFGAKYFSLILGMFPVDLNITHFLGIKVDWFIGEWFIGTIIWLYLISPFLDKCAVRFPILSLAMSIVIAYAVYCATQGLFEQERIFGRWSIFVVRIPEFLFGMILYIHREKLLQYKKILIPCATILLAVAMVCFSYDYPSPRLFFYPTEPTGCLLTLPTTYLAFNAAEFFNEHLTKIFDWFNSFNGVSYMAMLIQHMVIYSFTAAFNLKDLRPFGMVYLLLLITATIFWLSGYIKRYSDAAEKFVLKKV